VIAAVILAAGASARLGQPKQLLVHRGRTLLRHTVECAVDGGCDPVRVVLGAHADAVEGELEGSVARSVRHAAWDRGIGSSVCAGVAAVQRECARARGVLLLTCDQPRLTPQLVRRLRRRFLRGDAPIVACGYAGTVGVPALFARELFAELLALDGPTGAKPVLRAHAGEIVTVPWEDGAADIDRPEDLTRL